MKEYERKQLLERVEREGAIVGAEVPAEIELDGEPFPLREFVFEVHAVDSVPADRREQVEWAKKQLRRARLERRQQIEAGAVSFEEGERLAEAIVGIDRALNALENLDSGSVAAEAERQEQADRQRWFTFLRKALGRESDDRGPRGLGR